MKIIRKIIYPLTIIVILIILISILYIRKYLLNNQYEEINIESNIIKEQSQIQEEVQTNYAVDIKGAIKNPGVYIVDNNYNVNDVINLAGGLNKDADTSLINLAKKVTDQMVIIIYTKEEVKNSNIVNNVIKVVEKECVCPNIQNDSCINDKIEDNITNSTNNNLININTATKEELETISGLGESKANSIIRYREEHGNFNSIEDIKNVSGIGETLYEKIKIYITT